MAPYVGRSWVLCWAILALSWGHLGTMLGFVGSSWAYVGPAWDYVGRSWVLCWAILALCWPILGHVARCSNLTPCNSPQRAVFTVIYSVFCTFPTPILTPKSLQITLPPLPPPCLPPKTSQRFQRFPSSVPPPPHTPPFHLPEKLPSVGNAFRHLFRRKSMNGATFKKPLSPLSLIIQECWPLLNVWGIIHLDNFGYTHLDHAKSAIHRCLLLPFSFHSFDLRTLQALQLSCSNIAQLPEWLHYAETLERGALQRPFPTSHLKQLNSWMGRYEVVAPFELLHFVLDHWQNYGFIDQQCDSAGFIEVMHQLSNAPASTEKLNVCFNHEPLQHKDCRHGPRCSLQEMVDLMLKDFPIGFEKNSEEVLWQRSPCTGDEITGELRWMECKIDDWNVEVGLTIPLQPWGVGWG